MIKERHIYYYITFIIIIVITACTIKINSVSAEEVARDLYVFEDIRELKTNMDKYEGLEIEHEGDYFYSLMDSSDIEVLDKTPEVITFCVLSTNQILKLEVENKIGIIKNVKIKEVD